EEGILDRFGSVVVSDEVGWRKPRPVIFRQALSDLGVTAEECLFVGDRPEIDVAGAKWMGMAAAWLNPARAPLRPGLPTPAPPLASLAAARPAWEPYLKGSCRPRRRFASVLPPFAGDAQQGASLRPWAIGPPRRLDWPYVPSPIGGERGMRETGVVKWFNDA